MGKKGEKSLKGGAPASANSRGDDSSTPEPYTCTGNFPDDFSELWLRAGLDKNYAPVVRARGKPPSASPEEPKANKEEEQEQEEEPTLATFTVVPNSTFFRPSIQVDFEVEETKQLQINHAVQIFMRGWKLEEKVINVLKLCLLEKLTSINMWHVGLTDHTFDLLLGLLPSLSSIKSVSIEGNPIPATEPFHKLLSEDYTLQNISLRNNQITDKGAEQIGKMLGSTTVQNCYLVSLNLAFNDISDVGASHLAQGMRMNRTLTSLSLASNKISDQGAIDFANAIQMFVLTHEEVVCRRKFMSQQGLYGRRSSAPGSRRGDSKDRPGSNRSSSQLDKTRGSRGSSKKKPDPGKAPEKTPKKDDKGKKGAAVASETPKNKGKKSGGAGGKEGKRGGTALEVDAPDVLEQAHPLLDVRIVHKHGKVYTPGCFTLINLNLSRNRIGEVGMQNLLHALNYQHKQKERNSGMAIMGLMKLSLQGNRVPHDNHIYMEIYEHMLDRDPIKSDSKSPEDELQSVTG